MATACIEKIKADLEALGYCPVIDTMNGKETVIIDYPIPTGTYQGKNVCLGFSFGGDVLFPEHPPHWIHISPPYSDQEEGGGDVYSTADGREWRMLSRPPKDFWDSLPAKSTKSYMDIHIQRFCKWLK